MFLCTSVLKIRLIREISGLLLLQQKQQIVLRLVKQFYPQLEVLLVRVQFQQFQQLVAKFNVIKHQSVSSRGDRYLSHRSRHTQVPVPATSWFC